MRAIAYSIAIITLMVGCQSEISSGGEIVFTDVIGNYEGECADYYTSTSDLMNREEATLNVYAASITSAGIKTSCDRILDQSISLKSASAEQIVFEKGTGQSKITMTYITVSDSIVIVQTTDGQDGNLIFTGKRI